MSVIFFSLKGNNHELFDIQITITFKMEHVFAIVNPKCGSHVPHSFSTQKWNSLRVNKIMVIRS